MKNFRIMAVVTIAAAVSCNVQEPSCPLPEGEERQFEISSDDVRSNLSPDYSVTWSAGDRIDIVGESTRTQGILSTMYDGGRRALFRAGGVKPSDSELFAFYPPHSSAADPAPLVHADGSFELTVPFVQDGSFASANYCVARLEDGNRFRFHNLASIVRFSIEDEAMARSVLKIILSSGSGEPVAGRICTDMDKLADAWPEDPSSAVTLVPTGLNAGTAVYAAILPGQYESGLTLRLYDEYERLIKLYSCPMNMDVRRGMVLELGSVPLPAESAQGFSESFRRCFGKGGNDKVFDAEYTGTRLNRDNADIYCDRPGWDFHYVSAANGCIEFTAPEGCHSWMITPPLGIEGSATLSMRASYYKGAYYGMKFKVVGEGHLSVGGSSKPLFVLSGKPYGQMYDVQDIWMSGLTRDSRLMISTAYHVNNHTYIDDINIVPGAPDFNYLSLERSGMNFPPEGGEWRFNIDCSPGLTSMYSGAAPFADIKTGKDIYVGGKTQTPGAYVVSRYGQTYLLLQIPRNNTGLARKSTIYIYSSGPSAIFTVTQDAF